MIDVFPRDCLICPRPHGRGGFKVIKNPYKTLTLLRPRPHGRGGFKVTNLESMWTEGAVPAHTGGVDLRVLSTFVLEYRIASPPTRAGWI